MAKNNVQSGSHSLRTQVIKPQKETNNKKSRHEGEEDEEEDKEGVGGEREQEDDVSFAVKRFTICTKLSHGRWRGH